MQSKPMTVNAEQNTQQRLQLRNERN